METTVLLCAMFVSLGSITSAQTTEQLANRILNSSDRADGLCVIINASDPEMTTTLARRSKFVVHVVHDDADTIDAMRAAMESCGVYGRVSAQYSEMDRLPYAEDLVNLLVVEDYNNLEAQGITAASAKVFLSLKNGRLICVGE